MTCEECEKLAARNRELESKLAGAEHAVRDANKVAQRLEATVKEMRGALAIFRRNRDLEQASMLLEQKRQEISYRDDSYEIDQMLADAIDYLRQQLQPEESL